MSVTINSEALLSAARGALKHAYAPYSGFAVGAALLASSGRVYVGVNVENASFGATICAERSALSAAVSSGERKFAAIAICSSEGGLTPPCGICRQVLSEFSPDMLVLLSDGSQTPLSALLPSAFKL